MSRFLSMPSILMILVLFITLYVLPFYLPAEVTNLFKLKEYVAPKRIEERRSNTTKIILFWTTLFSDPHFYFGDRYVFRGCPVDDCLATDDRSYQSVDEFDALLFHGNEIDANDVPRLRNPRQWYVYVNLESPASRPMPKLVYDGYFNLTMTYRLDSDLVWPYAFVRDLRINEIVAPALDPPWDTVYMDALPSEELTEEEEELSRVIAAKRKPVTWFVSNCQAKSGRQAYAQELAWHVQVDVYGHCGQFECARTRDCLREVAEPEYFFYLSFENSLCTDYVTEKLYNALRYNIVPVVYSGANYTRFVPPHSYIDALDFDSPRELAAYLKHLMANPREYRKYFAWKTQYQIERGNHHVRCELCRQLHERTAPNVYDRLWDYYTVNTCPMQERLGEHPYLTRSLLKG